MVEKLEVGAEALGGKMLHSVEVDHRLIGAVPFAGEEDLGKMNLQSAFGAVC